MTCHETCHGTFDDMSWNVMKYFITCRETFGGFMTCHETFHETFNESTIVWTIALIHTPRQPVHIALHRRVKVPKIPSSKAYAR